MSQKHQKNAVMFIEMTSAAVTVWAMVLMATVITISCLIRQKIKNILSEQKLAEEVIFNQRIEEEKIQERINKRWPAHTRWPNIKPKRRFLGKYPE